MKSEGLCLLAVKRFDFYLAGDFTGEGGKEEGWEARQAIMLGMDGKPVLASGGKGYTTLLGDVTEAVRKVEFLSH